jgi:hypothetical protein
MSCLIEGASRSTRTEASDPTVCGRSTPSGGGNNVPGLPAMAGAQFSIRDPGAAATSTPDASNWAAPPPATAGAGPTHTTSGSGGSANSMAVSSRSSMLPTTPGEFSWMMAISAPSEAASEIASMR